MPEETEQLVVMLEARIRDFEKNMQKAEGTGTRSFKNLRAQSTSATRQMEADMIRSTTRVNQALATTETRIGAFGKAFSTGLKVGAVAAAAAAAAAAVGINKLKDALDELGDINDKSGQSGLDSEFFQEIAYQSSLAGVGVDELSGALNTFNKNAGLAVVNKGKMVAALKALNPELLENIRNAESQEQRIKLVADAIDKESDASKKAAIASAAFGDVGAKLVSVFQGGAAGIDQTAAAAQKMGIIFSRDLVNSSDDLGDKLDTITRIIDVQLKEAIVNLGPALVGMTGYFAEGAKWVNVLIDHLKTLDAESDKLLNTKLTMLGQQQLDLETKLLEKRRERAAMEKMPESNLSMEDEDIADLNTQLAENAKQQARITEILHVRNKATAEAKQPTDQLSKSLVDNADANTKAVKGINSYADAIRALKDEIPELSAELDKLTTKAKINDAYKAAVNKAQTMGEVYQANDLYNRANKATDVKAATSDSTNYLSGFLTSGKTRQSVEKMQKQFSDNLAKMLASAPDDVRNNVSIFSGYRSVERQQQLWQDALRKYGSVEEARKWVAPPGHSQHNEGEAADLRFGNNNARDWFHQNAGQFGLTFPLKNESWHIEDADARGKLNSQATEDKTKSLEDLGKSYDDIIAKGRQYVAEQGQEGDALGMTTEAASAYKHQQDMLREAQEAGITLTQTQRDAIAALAQQMAQAEGSTQSLADAQQRMQQAGEEAFGTLKDATGGFIKDLAHGATGAEALRNALAKLGDSAIDSLINSLFGGGANGGAKGGLFGGLFGKLFSGGFQANTTLGGFLGFNAKGTDNWRGGPTVVGEKGPEIINAPRGSQIIPNNRLGNQQSTTVVKEAASELNVHIIGANGDDHVKALVEQGVSVALAQRDEQMRRSGFGLMQTRYGNQKG